MAGAFDAAVVVSFTIALSLPDAAGVAESGLAASVSIQLNVLAPTPFLRIYSRRSG
jgi:hypothetical protein